MLNLWFFTLNFATNLIRHKKFNTMGFSRYLHMFNQKFALDIYDF
jgi:hypothetical protein